MRDFWNSSRLFLSRPLVTYSSSYRSIYWCTDWFQLTLALFLKPVSCTTASFSIWERAQVAYTTVPSAFSKADRRRDTWRREFALAFSSRHGSSFCRPRPRNNRSRSELQGASTRMASNGPSGTRPRILEASPRSTTTRLERNFGRYNRKFCFKRLKRKASFSMATSFVGTESNKKTPAMTRNLPPGAAQASRTARGCEVDPAKAKTGMAEAKSKG